MVQHINVPALKKQWVLDAQWTDCPPEVEEVINHLWSYKELGNDNYMLRRSINDFLEWMPDGIFNVEQWFWGETIEEKKGWVEAPTSIQPLIDYLRAKGVKDDEEVILHWWW